jgi:hypothetical protein
MTDNGSPWRGPWSDFMDSMNEEFVDAMERTMEAQTDAAESWTDAIEESTEDDELAEGMKGYVRAYEVWMDAAEEMAERATDALDGDDVDPSEFRDVWLSAANRAFKETMETSAFAAMTGQTVEAMTDAQGDAEAAQREMLHRLGFSTEGDVREVGERLVELERRQQAVERKLDTLIEAADE